MNHDVHKNALREKVSYSSRVIPSIGFNRMRMKMDEHQHPALNMHLNMRVMSNLLADTLECEMQQRDHK